MSKLKVWGHLRLSVHTLQSCSNDISLMYYDNFHVGDPQPENVLITVLIKVIVCIRMGVDSSEIMENYTWKKYWPCEDSCHLIIV